MANGDYNSVQRFCGNNSRIDGCNDSRSGGSNGFGW